LLFKKFTNKQRWPENRRGWQGARSLKLSADEITSLEEPYVPHAVVGFV